eukprot:gene344-195_t
MPKDYVDDVDEEAWMELIDLDEIDELGNGPSTFFVGGFSVCNRLSGAIERVQYKEDRVLVFPGVYGGPEARSPQDRDDVVELDEFRLAGLHIEGVPFSLGKKGGYPVKDKLPKVGRRVGPWYTYYAAAAANIEESSGKAMLESAKTTTSMASSVYGRAVTPTAVDPVAFPLLATRLVLKYDMRPEAERDADPRRPLVRYEQEADEEGEEEADEEGEGEADGERRRDGDGEEEEEDEEDDAPKTVTTIVLQGLCFLGGLVVEPLTRSLIRHCVFGIPTTVMPNFPITETATVVAKALGEVALENSVIYGGTKYGIYAFPRSRLNVRHCIIDGPGTTAALLQGANCLRSVRHLSVLALLEYRTRFRAGLAQTGKQPGSETDRFAHFVVPDAVVCDVGVFCDDADVYIQDCIISNTRLGLCLRRLCKEVGVYYYGLSGCARLRQSCISACGRECLLIKGLHEAEVQKELQQYKLAHNVKDVLADEEEEEPEADEEDAVETGPRPRVKTSHPNFAQHPSIRQCTIVGAVRLQCDVRTGALSDNLVFRPLKEGELSVAAVGDIGDKDLITGPNIGAYFPPTVAGFTYCGVEGTRQAPAEGAECCWAACPKEVSCSPPARETTVYSHRW